MASILGKGLVDGDNYAISMIRDAWESKLLEEQIVVDCHIVVMEKRC